MYGGCLLCPLYPLLVPFMFNSNKKKLQKLREKRLTTYSFTFIARVFVKSAKLKYSFFESPENEEVFLELSFCLNVPCVSVNACPSVNNLTVAQVFEIAFHKKYNSPETLWLRI